MVSTNKRGLDFKACRIFSPISNAICKILWDTGAKYRISANYCNKKRNQMGRFLKGIIYLHCAGFQLALFPCPLLTLFRYITLDYVFPLLHSRVFTAGNCTLQFGMQVYSLVPPVKHKHTDYLKAL